MRAQRESAFCLAPSYIYCGMSLKDNDMSWSRAEIFFQKVIKGNYQLVISRLELKIQNGNLKGLE